MRRSSALTKSNSRVHRPTGQGKTRCTPQELEMKERRAAEARAMTCRMALPSDSKLGTGGCTDTYAVLVLHPSCCAADLLAAGCAAPAWQRFSERWLDVARPRVQTGRDGLFMSNSDGGCGDSTGSRALL